MDIYETSAKLKHLNFKFTANTRRTAQIEKCIAGSTDDGGYRCYMGTLKSVGHL